MNGAHGALSSVVHGSLQKKDSLFFFIDVCFGLFYFILFFALYIIIMD